jgi:hypothetical protein
LGGKWLYRPFWANGYVLNQFAWDFMEGLAVTSLMPPPTRYPFFNGYQMKKTIEKQTLISVFCGRPVDGPTNLIHHKT